MAIVNDMFDGNDSAERGSSEMKEDSPSSIENDVQTAEESNGVPSKPSDDFRIKTVLDYQRLLLWMLLSPFSSPNSQFQSIWFG